MNKLISIMKKGPKKKQKRCNDRLKCDKHAKIADQVMFFVNESIKRKPESEIKFHKDHDKSKRRIIGIFVIFLNWEI